MSPKVVARSCSGQRVLQVNALGGTNWFAEGRDFSSGGGTNQTLDPDGGVRLERCAGDGSVLEISARRPFRNNPSTASMAPGNGDRMAGRCTSPSPCRSNSPPTARRQG